MDLVIAMQQFTTIIDIRQAHRASAREGNRPCRYCTAAARITAGAGVRNVTSDSAVLEVDSVASRDAIPEVQQPFVAGGTAALERGNFVV